MEENLYSEYQGRNQVFYDKSRHKDGMPLKVAIIENNYSHITYFEEVSENGKKTILKEAATVYRLFNSKIPAGNIERVAVVVQTEYEKGKVNLGIQFWTPEMIEAGSSQNTDHTVSHYVGLHRWIKKGKNENIVKLYDWSNDSADRFAVDSGRIQMGCFKTIAEAIKMFNEIKI